MSRSEPATWLGFHVEQPYPAQRMPNKTRYTSVAAAKALAFQRAVGLRAAEAMRLAGLVLVTPADSRFVAVAVTLYHTAPLARAKRRYDVDNVLKAILDGCNRVVWSDDWLVVRADVELRWSRADDLAVVTVSLLDGVAIDPTYYTGAGDLAGRARREAPDAPA